MVIMNQHGRGFKAHNADGVNILFLFMSKSAMMLFLTCFHLLSSPCKILWYKYYNSFVLEYASDNNVKVL